MTNFEQRIGFAGGAKDEDVSPFNSLEPRLAQVGIASAEQTALGMLERCWAEHKPNVLAAVESFADALEKTSPLLVAVMGRKRFKEGINAFVYNKHKEISLEYKRRNAALGQKERFERVGYSMTPGAIATRKSRHNSGKNIPVGAVSINDTVPVNNLEKDIALNREWQARKKRGIVRVKLDINPAANTVTLVSRLPESLRSFADWSADKALAWCDAQEGHARAKLAQVTLVRLWCSQAADLRKTLGENLTPEIVATLTKEAA